MAESFADFVAGYVSGVAGIIVGSPLDIIKVRLQSGHISGSRPGEFNTVSNLVRGSAAPILGYGALNALLFVSYNKALHSLGENSSHPQSLLKIWTAGAIGGLACFVVSTPTELIKCRAQVRHDSRTSWAISKEIFREKGITGFYRGGVVTSMRDAIGYGFYFWAYEGCKQTLMNQKDSPTESTLKLLFAGGVAGCATWASIYPLDVVKTVLQTRSFTEGEHGALLSRPRQQPGAWYYAKDAYYREGISVFFRGFWACMARAFIVNAVTFFTYEYSLNMLKNTHALQPSFTVG